MSSLIDPTKPTAGNATTASVRANFAAAKAEIEAIQATVSTVTISVQNYVTAAQLADARAGTTSFDATTAIQAAIDAADALSSYSNSNSRVPIILPAGKWRVDTAITIKTGVLFVGDGVIYNNLVSTTDPCVLVNLGGAATRIVVDANSKAGIRIGEPAGGGIRYIGELNISNVGTSVGQMGVYITGTNNYMDKILVVGGYAAVSFGDGASTANGASNSFVAHIYATTARAGVQIYGGQDIDLGYCIATSCTYAGVLADRCKGLSGIIRTMWNDSIGGTKFSSGGAVVLGEASSGDPMLGASLNIWGDNTAGPIVKAKDIQKSYINITKCNGTLSSGSANPATYAVNFIAGGAGAGNLWEIQDLDTFGLSAVNGTVTGTALIKDYVGNINTPGGFSSSKVRIWGDAVARANNEGLDEVTGWILARKTVDQSFTSTTTLANVTNFGIASGVLVAPSGIKYMLRWVLRLGAALATTGFKVSVAGSDIARVSYVPDVPNAANRPYKEVASSGTLDFTAAELAGCGSAMVTIEAVVSGTTIVLQLAQSTSSGTALTVYTNSVLSGGGIA